MLPISLADEEAQLGLILGLDAWVEQLPRPGLLEDLVRIRESTPSCLCNDVCERVFVNFLQVLGVIDHFGVKAPGWHDVLAMLHSTVAR